MEYISASEAAEKWGVTIRQVQRLLHSGRISGAKKCGVSWLIPSDAIKPRDPRAERGQIIKEAPEYVFLPDIHYPKSNPAAMKISSEKYRKLILADMDYRRGNPESAKTYWKNLNGFSAETISSSTLAVAAAISSGDYELYYEISNYLKKRIIAAPDDRAKALLSIPCTMAAVSTSSENMTPEWLKKCDFSMFDKNIYPFLLYLYAMHLRTKEDYAGVLATSRTALMLCGENDTFTWLDISFGILSAGAAYALGDTQSAEAFFSAALKLGIPYGFITPFADHLGALGGMAETLIGTLYPQYLNDVVNLWNTSFKNWMRFHNEFAKDNISTVLTAREYQTAHLLVRGATYAQIALQMNLSVGRVKNIVTDIYRKLYIKKRSELSDFIL